MISFDMKCSRDHVFEAWFGSSADYADQSARGLVVCPVCDDRAVEKAVMAPAVGAKGNSAAKVAADRERLARLMRWQRRIEAQSDHVGRNFATAARARHALPAAEQPERGLIGEAPIAEAAELLEEGIAILPLPLPLARDADA